MSPFLSPRRFLVVSLCLVAFFAPVSKADGLLDLVNTLQGTDSTSEFSHGNTLPLVGMPWGMTNWSPQTAQGKWYFEYKAEKISGIRATRQPSPWIGDYGWFTLLPQTGDIQVDPVRRAARYDKSDSIFRPDYLKLHFKKEGITTELTATQRCAVARMTFASGGVGRLLVASGGHCNIEIVGRQIRGSTDVAQSGVPKNFKGYFIVEFNRDLSGVGAFSKNTVHAGDRSVDADDAGVYAEFATSPESTIEVRVATSLISLEQAQRNLDREITGGFEAVHKRVAADWEEHLGRVQIEGASEEERKTFYTCIYRAIMFPHGLYEFDANNKPIHYSPYDGQIHPGVLYTDNGFWDTHRTVYPLYSVLFPKELGEILQGFVNAYEEGGWFPQWPSPAYRDVMIGTHIDAVFADAIVKGIKGFDVEKAYEGLHKDAFVPQEIKGGGRAGLSEYVQRGYVPDKLGHHPVSTSLDYAYDDWCVAQAAKVLQKKDDYAALMERSQNYRKLWDPGVGFMRPKKSDGAWAGDFDQFAWGGAYVEGGPWQCTWAVPHDVRGLMDLIGGKQATIDKLDQMMELPSTYHVGEYKHDIHEMVEMVATHLGQYNHGNQPSHHILYLFAAAGAPAKTEYWTRRVCRELYNSGPDGFCGDEDNGEMASWYILNTIGIYPLCPGRPVYILTSPLFTKTTLHLENNQTFTIDAPANKEKNVYVAARKLNGAPYTNTWLTHEAIEKGGVFSTDMTDAPVQRKLSDDEMWESEKSKRAMMGGLNL